MNKPLTFNDGTKVTAYNCGWIGLRVAKMGRARKLLKDGGWIKFTSPHNNQAGWDWATCGVRPENFATFNFEKMAAAGLEATAVWYTDAQHGANGGVPTNRQWANRRRIEAGVDMRPGLEKAAS